MQRESFIDYLNDKIKSLDILLEQQQQQQQQDSLGELKSTISTLESSLQATFDVYGREGRVTANIPLDMVETHDSLFRSMYSLVDQIQRQNTVIDQLNARTQQQQEILQSHERDISEKEDVIRSLQAQIAASHVDRDRMQYDLDHFKDMGLIAKDELKDLRAQLRVDANVDKEHIATLREENAELKASLDAAGLELARLVEQYAPLNQDLARMQSKGRRDHDWFSVQLREKDRIIADLRGRIESMERKITKTTRLNQKDISDMRDEREQQIRDMTDKIDQLNEQNRELIQQNRELSKENQQLRAEREEEELSPEPNDDKPDAR
jgi:chromosome segregation ATPase